MTFVSRNARRAVIAGIAGIIVAGVAVSGIRHSTTRRDEVRYITHPAAYTDISTTVTETGTINPVDTVQIGTQVSGTIAVINVDYNSKVKKGMVLATLDPAPFRAAVAQAGANLAAARAGHAAALSAIAQDQAAVESALAAIQQAQANLRSAEANAAKIEAQSKLAQVTVKRDASLLQQGFIPQNQMDADQTALESTAADTRAAQAAVAVAQAQAAGAAAQLRSAEAQVTTAQAQAAAAQEQIASQAAQLQQAAYNLSRTVITSPVDGIVMARNVSVGQTVAASFQTPTLFTLATNLTDMQVDTSVDEADVRSVREGETANISVTALPNVVFSGTVQQVRVNPTVVQNVVTYDAVVIVHDSSGRLMPGMTAQVTIDAGTRAHVLAVPIEAALYRPLTRSAHGKPESPASPPVAGAPGSHITLWTLRNGKPRPVPVVIGFSDGVNLEITDGNLHAGDPVIIEQARGAAWGGAERTSAFAAGGGRGAVGRAAARAARGS
ncbi:MAG: biotin/lipoyl-binding protein [Bacillati bacterium ANGP1]|uniref:Biotin/lipoyl-binding protein n=1 Tax=Candidatus Segetimicrobium genomatis TaxID=2569760 RepID=A0A537J4V1_9BACT|nr:MAG: biotin/lipoyl-binding protein [Terrabacteria group bacterium ANGP1]